MKSSAGFASRSMQAASPVNAATVVMVDDSRERTLWLTPAAAIASVTITFPTDAKSELMQIVYVGSSKEITAVTFGGATVQNAPAGLIANDLFSFQKVGANTWVMMQ